MPKIEILLPTLQKRQSLLSTIHSCLGQTFKDFRLSIILEYGIKPTEELIELEKSDDRIRIITCPKLDKSKFGQETFRWAIENLDICDWFVGIGDDDMLTYWALEELYKHTEEGIGMIIGQSYAFSSKDFRHLAIYGDAMSMGRITGGSILFNMKLLRNLKKPWINDTVYESDWHLIKKMMVYPYKQIKAITYMLSMWQFDELNEYDKNKLSKINNGKID